MSILLVVHIFVTIFLILIVLMQKNEGGSSLFASSASSSGMMTARGAVNFVTKITWICAIIFIGNCILMAALDSSVIRKQESIVESKMLKSSR